VRKQIAKNQANCREGSLENSATRAMKVVNANCREGSLEIIEYDEIARKGANCREGSLENCRDRC